MRWQVVETKEEEADKNMQIDASLLSSITPNGSPILRFYDWKTPSITFGIFVDPEKHLHIEKLKNQGFSLAKRPTGGGIVFHHVDFTFSLLIPAYHPFYSSEPLKNYLSIHKVISKVIDKFHEKEKSTLLETEKTSPSSCRFFCMAKPTKYDLLYQGKKVGGAAQRRTKNGFLHQGTLCLSIPESSWLEEILVGGKTVAEAMGQNSYPLENVRKKKTKEEIKQELKGLFVQAFCY